MCSVFLFEDFTFFVEYIIIFSMKYVLASASPRRRELLKKILPQFDVCVADFEEKATSDSPIDVVAEFSYGKAKAVADKISGAVVIGADTVVSLEGKVFGKPKSEQEAKEMLFKLSGAVHDVFTGVCILGECVDVRFVDRTQVVFKRLTVSEIDDYVAGGSPFDKAGAYGIQDSNFVEKIVGSYDNVMGLPTEKLQQALAEINER